MLTFLKGKKTYLIAGLTALYAVVGVYLGLMDVNDAITLVFGALGLGALRAGVAGVAK